jgi:hypothetical protein
MPQQRKIYSSASYAEVVDKNRIGVALSSCVGLIFAATSLPF